jgi:AcrR family transcriptional regulator
MASPRLLTPPPSKREQNREEQRRRIFEAARSLFGSRGFDQVSMAEVAARARVARATVFNYFPSKYALVEAITEEVLAYWHGMLERALADRESPTPALVRALFDHMGWGIEQTHVFYRGVFREILKVRVGLDEGGATQRLGEASFALLQRLIERGQARGDLSRAHDAADLARAFDALANGTIVAWLYDEETDSLHERMRRAVRIFLGPVALESEAASHAALPDVAPENVSVPLPEPTEGDL